MAETRLIRPAQASPVILLRVALVLAIWLMWEAVAASGLLYEGVVPSSFKVIAALGRLLVDGSFYYHLWVTGYEIAVATAIGAGFGIVAGLALGGSRFLGAAYEPYLYYLGPTPKIVFLPILIILFGVGPGSKIAMGALSCFFPMALSVAAGMRQVDRVLIRVGRSFNANTRQMVQKVYLPALVQPIVNGLRLGLGVAVIGVLLAEIKLSNRGLGFLAIQAYNQFRIPDMYALLLVVFVLAILLNGLVARIGRRHAAAVTP